MNSLDTSIFCRVDKKLQSLAKIIFVVGIILSIILGFICLITTLATPFMAIGIPIAILIAISSYITSLFIYGFGQLIEYERVQSNKNTTSNS